MNDVQSMHKGRPVSDYLNSSALFEVHHDESILLKRSVSYSLSSDSSSDSDGHKKKKKNTHAQSLLSEIQG
ncbi:hypothetical protein HMI54_011600 [Coelomomyces lativittatus]|nr:hypothetical protein HMI54_011600 [Coelomomyces lativittatus]